MQTCKCRCMHVCLHVCILRICTFSYSVRTRPDHVKRPADAHPEKQEVATHKTPKLQPKSLAPNAMWGPLRWQCCVARSICSRRRATCGWQHCTEDSQTATAAAVVVVAIVAAGIAAAGGGVIVAAATRTWKRIPWPHGTDDLSPNPA